MTGASIQNKGGFGRKKRSAAERTVSTDEAHRARHGERDDQVRIQMVDVRPTDTAYTIAFREGRVLSSVRASDDQGDHAGAGHTVLLGKSPSRTPAPVARRPFFWEFPAGAAKDARTGRPVQERAYLEARQAYHQQQTFQQQQAHQQQHQVYQQHNQALWQPQVMADNPFDLSALRQRPSRAVQLPPEPCEPEPPPDLPSNRSLGARTAAAGTVGSLDSDRSLGGFSTYGP